jgi:hypothetical protein
MTKTNPRPPRIVPLTALTHVVGGAQPPRSSVITGLEFPEAKPDLPTSNAGFSQLAFPQ